MKLTFKNTIIACFIGYIVQAIVNNFIPLLFLTFQKIYNIPLDKITLLVTFNFGVQLLTDLLASKYVDKIGYRISIVLAHVFSSLGLILLTLLPQFINPFFGILIAVMIYAIGGGLLEVLVSPIMESCPTDNKESAMSLLHSFYCWGHVGVVLLSTLFFYFVGIEHWKILACIWSLLPIANAILFLKTPIAPLLEDEQEKIPFHKLCMTKIFWILIIMMLCSGASEHSIAQWASTFAEAGLGISKTAGDLAGPMTFAILMGISRALYGKFADKINLKKFMLASSVLCIISYLLTALTASPILSLLGCALTGLSVGIMWPGTFSTAASSLRAGGTTLFALLALAGDLGCSIGPTLVGFVSNATTGQLQTGILAAVIFPVLLVICILNTKHNI
ncbi:MAG: MFS transporter [Lachnospiraceae bacterium]|nr:MFS transporter [Lachnospiraceae bacterium]